MKRLYLTLWAFGLVAGALGFVAHGEPLTPLALGSILLVFIVLPASIFVAGKWIFKGLYSARHE